MFIEDSSIKNILIIAAHPDDEVLGVGGTIAKYTGIGVDVYVCILADGATSRYEDWMVTELQENALKAANILKVKEAFFEGLPDERLDQIPFIDVVKSIERRITETKPDTVFVHHRGDANTDHQIAFKATIAATRTLKTNIINRILCYEVPSSTEQSPPFIEYTFTPNVFFDITNTLSKKMEAVQVYKSEIREYPHPRSVEALSVAAKHWGVKVGLEAAEAFMLVREIIH
jgi:LmbE family N-acetylglucosaminyl deacetylase